MSKKLLMKVITLGVVFSLSVSTFVACNKKEKDVAQQPTTTSSNGTYDTSKPIEFTVYWNYSWYNQERKWGETTISKEIEKKMNCKINFAKPDGDPAEKLNIMLTSDTLPDVVIMDRDANYKKLIELGRLVEIDKLIDKYPGYKKSVEAATINLAKQDGKSYGLLNWATTSKHPTGNGGWVVNEKIYKEMGSPAIATLDDMFNYTKAVKDKGIKINGKDVVPMQFDPGNYQDGLNQLYFSYGGIGTISNQELCYIPNGSKELKFFMQDSKWEQAMLYANKMWKAGLMNTDFFVETAQQKNDKRDSGRVAVYTSSNGVNEARDGMNAWKTADKDGSYIVIDPPAAGGLKQADIMNNTYNTLGWNSICITKKAKDPERIFGIFDWIASPEGQLLTFYGPKGILYDELDKDGYPIIKKNRSELSDKEGKDLACEVYSMPGVAEWCDFSKVAADNRLSPDKRDFVIQAQSKIAWKHSKDVTEFVGMFTDPATDEGIIFNQVQDLVRKNIAKIVMAKDEQTCKDAIKETTAQAYKLGFEKVEKFKTKVWQDNLKAMGK